MSALLAQERVGIPCYDRRTDGGTSGSWYVTPGILDLAYEEVTGMSRV